MYPISKFGTEVKKVEDLPLDPHWQIWVQEAYTPYTGYEKTDGVGGRSYRWRTYVYMDENEWRADLLKLNEDLLDPENKYNTNKVFLGFEAGGRVEALVNITLAGKPPRGRG